MSRSWSTNLFSRPGSVAIYGKFYLCCLYHFRLFSGLWIIQIWCINYALRFLEVLRYTNIVYIGVYLVLTNIEILFSTVSYFLSYFCWSVSCLGWDSKFHKFFWHAQELRQGLYFRAFSIIIYGKFNSNFPVF